MMGVYRAVLISGPPGIGKTTAAHLVSKIEGFVPLELNASDVRSKKLLEATANIDNTAIDSFFGDKVSLEYSCDRVFNYDKGPNTSFRCQAFTQVGLDFGRGGRYVRRRSRWCRCYQSAHQEVSGMIVTREGVISSLYQDSYYMHL